ncbi:hypothetical protein [Glycomyces buryatensis]|uniref:Uncharacterized protein n=1 Tax=Glycomyces buryatensis TaxID=2570927 RepID=A0A4S8QHP1_9ACTN|nr:hypothetical protein [Glycomyces buryatensis]THV40919.1 hypothetical protein FAB82_13805 [Glycomyces buryatensis]
MSMQHSARSTPPLTPDAQGAARAFGRQDRSVPLRRSSRHTAPEAAGPADVPNQTPAAAAEQATPATADLEAPGAGADSEAGPVARAVEAAAAAFQGPGRGRRSRRQEIDSLFSLEEPPPIDAPPGITEITGWELAASMWRDHRPEQLLGFDCASCKQSWPCDGWQIADDLLTECCEAAGATATRARV